MRFVRPKAVVPAPMVVLNMFKDLKVIDVSDSKIIIDISESDVEMMKDIFKIQNDDMESFNAAFSSFVNDAIVHYLKGFEDGK